MAYPDGTPLDPDARWAELGALAGRHREWHPVLRSLQG